MITLYGASGHAKVIKDIIIDQNLKIESVVDDNPNVNDFQGMKVGQTTSLLKTSFVIIAIGNNKIRKELSLKLEVNYVNAICHSSSLVSNTAQIGKGSVIMPKAVVNADSIIGDHCIVNSAAIIEHDCIVSSYTHISPGAILTGGVSIEEGVHIGAGAIILPGVKIGSWSTIGAGAIVLRDVPSNVIVVGNPAVILKK